MADELKRKYLPPSFYHKLLDNTIEQEAPMKVLSKFRAGLRNDLQAELFARGIDTLERAYALVQDLDEVKSHRS
uniref:Uncharacterized protein n=1 Tax=Asparagus officinalis TaxID=4686 RepID=Q2AA98_ASPOF|nr:hypothetical protein 17.t00026 [Asparagus officinalis]